jgi:hypothetical protein
MQKIAQIKLIQDMLKTRVKNFDNQIQQYQVNPQIGRTVSTKTPSAVGEPAQPAEQTAGY